MSRGRVHLALEVGVLLLHAAALVNDGFVLACGGQERPADYHAAEMKDRTDLDDLTASGRARRPNATVLILPREDGQYGNHAIDAFLLLEEVGVSVDYATDPMAAGVHAEKDATILLPPLLVLFSDAATYAGAVEGIVYLIRWFSRGVPSRKVQVDVVVEQSADGSSRREVRLGGVTAQEAERLLHEAGNVRPPK